VTSDERTVGLVHRTTGARPAEHLSDGIRPKTWQNPTGDWLRTVLSLSSAAHEPVVLPAPHAALMEGYFPGREVSLGRRTEALPDGGRTGPTLTQGFFRGGRTFSVTQPILS